MNDFLRSAFAGSAALGLTGTLAPLVTLVSYKDARLADPLIALWARGLLASAGVRVVSRGVENVPQGSTFVLTLNHQSHFDGPVLYSQIGERAHLRFVGKA